MATNGPDAPPQPTPPPTPATPTPVPPKRSTSLPQAWLLAVGLLVAFGLFYLSNETPKTINYTEYEKLAADGQIKRLVIQGKQRAEGEAAKLTERAVREPTRRPVR